MSLFPQALTQVLLEQAIFPTIGLFVLGMLALILRIAYKIEIFKWIALFLIFASLATPIFMASRAIYFQKKAVEIFANGPPEMEETDSEGYDKDIILKNGPYTLILHRTTFDATQRKIKILKREENFSDPPKK